MTFDQECIFCRIAAGEFDTPFVAESDRVVAFDDLAPQAETHVLVIPRQHISSIAAIGESENDLIGEMLAVANRVARDRGIDSTGYRLLTNHGEHAGQTVFHLHFHVLGGNVLGPLG